MEEKSNKKGMRAVIALVAVILIGVVVLTVVIADMIKEKGGVSFKEDTTEYTLAGVTNSNEEKSTLINWDETENSAANNADNDTYGDNVNNNYGNVGGNNSGNNVGGNAGGNNGDNAGDNNGGNAGGLIGNIIGNLFGGNGSADKNNNNNGNNDNNNNNNNGNNNNNANNNNNNGNTGNSKVPTSQNSNIQAGDVVTTPATTKKPNNYDPIAEYEELTKNGDNILSDHHNNKYIKLVSEKFGVDKELLVAIYSTPDTGNNFVLEFDGKKDKDGNVIKSPDTLKKVYQIDKNKNISVATGKTTGNIGVSYAEGTLCFNMIQNIVMPQYPEYFTGV